MRTEPAGQGSNPKWNEKFTFRAEYPGSGSDYKLILKLMDKDTFSADDYLGQATYVMCCSHARVSQSSPFKSVLF